MSAKNSDAAVSRWVARFVAQQAAPEPFEERVRRITEGILATVPEIHQVDGMTTGIEGSVRGHWRALLHELAKEQFRFQMPQGGEQIALDVARAHLPLETLIGFYRVAQKALWADITGIVNGIPDDDLDHAEVLIYLWDRMAAWIDEGITASIDVYQTERSRVLAGAAARRYEMAQAVLDGDLEDVRQISTALGGYPVSVHHTALVLGCDHHDDVEELENLARGLARAAGATQPLLVRPGGRQVWAWIATRDALDPDVIVAAFTSRERGAFRVAVGSATPHVAGFISSHHEALRTLSLLRPDGTAQIQAYADAELLVLLGCSPEVDRFVVNTLQGLVRDDAHTQRLRETIAVYLYGGGNVDDAARRLTVHRNTIRYRIAQAEELLGQPIARLNAEVTVSLRHLDAHHRDGSLADRAVLPSD
ncbi:MAG: helix-turn-helix domain-containing protein [Nocardioidaceae bacterium]|nr:helix-turn-helix domain-containing protein [Nocardioidaceae bacterium]